MNIEKQIQILKEEQRLIDLIHSNYEAESFIKWTLCDFYNKIDNKTIAMFLFNYFNVYYTSFISQGLNNIAGIKNFNYNDIIIDVIKWLSKGAED